MAKDQAKKTTKQTRKSSLFRGKFNEQKVTATNVAFSSLYEDNRLWVRYLIAAAIGILMAFIVQICVKNTGLYSSGLSGINQGIARIANVLMLKYGLDESIAKAVFNAIFWGLYFLLNVPLLILSYKIIGKTFVWLSLTYLLINTIFGFGFSYIPGIENIAIFGNAKPSSYFREFPDDGSSLEYKNYLVQTYGICIIPFSYGHLDTFYVSPSGFKTFNPIFLVDKDPIKAVYLLLYGVAYGFLSAVCYSVLYIIGSCSGGADFVSFMYAIKRQKSINAIVVIVNLSTLIVGVIIGSYTAAILACPQYCAGYQWLFSANLLGSLISVFVFRMTFSKFYPSNTLVNLKICTNKSNEVVNKLKEIYYLNFVVIDTNIETSNFKTNAIVNTICMYSQVNQIIKLIREVDQDCLVVTNMIKHIDGKIMKFQPGSLD